MSTNGFLMITELFLPTKGGTAVWFDEVYRRLGGRKTHILTAAVPEDSAHDRGHPNSVHRLRLEPSAWLWPASLPVYAKLIAVATWLALRHRFDAIHAGRVLPEGLAGLVAARIARRPLVVYAHGEELTTWRRSPRRLRAMRFVFRHADAVVANSEFTKQELIGLGTPEERIHIIHPGVNLERFHPGYDVSDLRRGLGLGESDRLILSVGRLTRRKGFDKVIECLPDLLTRGISAHHAIVGIGEAEPELRARARECGVEDRVHLLGAVSAEELPRWYCAADVFAMPNRDIGGDTEGFGMVFVEAAACGVPAIAGRAGGTAAAVLQGVTGLIVNGSDTEAIRCALMDLLGDGDLARRLADAGRRRAVAELGWDSVAERTIDLTERLGGCADTRTV